MNHKTNMITSLGHYVTNHPRVGLFIAGVCVLFSLWGQDLITMMTVYGQ